MNRDGEFRPLFEMSAVGVAEVSYQGLFLHVNRKLCEMLGYSEQELLQRTLFDVTHPCDRQISDANLRSSFTGVPQEYSIEKRYLRKDGAVIWSLCTWTIIRDAHGVPLHALIIVQDITGRKLAEEALSAREAQLRAIIDNSSTFIFVKDLEGRYLRVNRWYEKMRGLSEAEMLGKTDADLYPKEIADAVRENDCKVLAANKPIQFEEHVAFSDGIHHFVATKFPLVSNDGAPYAICGIAADITERKRAEVAQQESELLNQAVLGSLRANIAVLDRAGTIIRVNEAWKRFAHDNHGVPLADPVGMNYLEVCRRSLENGDEDARRPLNGIQGVLSGADQDFQIEYPCHSPTERRWFLMSVTPLVSERGGAVVTHRDITQRKVVEEALQESDERLKLAMEAGEIGTFDWNIQTNEVIWTEQSKVTFGQPRTVSRGSYLDWASRVHSEDLPACESSINVALQNKQSHWQSEYRMMIDDGGRPRWVSSQGRIYYDDRGEPVRMIGTNMDVTESKRAGEALRQSEARLRQLADVMPQIVFTYDADGSPDYANHQWYEYTGLSQEESKLIEWHRTLHPDDQANTLHLWAQAVKSRLSFEAEFRVRRKDGQYRWHLARAIPIVGADKEVIKWIGTSTDIHDRKQAEADREELLAREQAARSVELRALRQAEEANRMKDEFLALVSHELRSPLNAMVGYARLLRHRPLDPQKIDRAVDVIERGGRAQTQLIEDLLDTARIINGKLRLDVAPVSLATVIQAAVQTIYPAADAKGITIHTDLNPRVGQISGDAERLQQVIWNLLSNAVKFTPAGGHVDLCLERVDPHICIIISDTGKGISPDFLPFIFDRFRQADASSTRRYGGLGLGLSLVKYLVELHGGTIEAFSEGEGKGATFKVLLPVRAVSGPPETFRQPESPERVDKAALIGTRILVVDDEDDARELVKTVLADYGAEVVAASSAAEGLTLITTAPADKLPNVIVTDLGMPKEDGYQLLRRLRSWQLEHRVFIPAVALTAFGRYEDRLRALKAGFQMHVAKPVEPDELVIVISSILRQSGILGTERPRG